MGEGSFCLQKHSSFVCFKTVLAPSSAVACSPYKKMWSIGCGLCRCPPGCIHKITHGLMSGKCILAMKGCVLLYQFSALIPHNNNQFQTYFMFIGTINSQLNDSFITGLQVQLSMLCPNRLILALRAKKGHTTHPISESGWGSMSVTQQQQRRRTALPPSNIGFKVYP